jgi:uncharacterized membrane protein
MLVVIILAFLAFAAVSYFMPDPQAKRIAYFGMVVCVIAFAIIVVLHIAGIAPATWPYGVRP